MTTRTIYSLVLAGVLFISAPVAQAMTLEQAVAKIDSMIAEMQALRAELATLAPASVPTAPTPAVQGAQTSSVFTLPLEYGETNDDITRVQELLATDPEIYPDGIVSGFFGPKTQEAIRRFQARFGLDTVGVVGPSTKALLELFVSAYPDGNYPDGVLDTQPTSPAPTPVVSTSVTTPVQSTPVVSTGVISSLSVEEDDQEYIIRSYDRSGERNRDILLYPDSFDELVEGIAARLGASEAEVLQYVDESDYEGDRRRGSGDEDDAEDALDAADEAIDDTDDEIDEADEDGDDVDWAEDTLRDAKDRYDDAEEAFEDGDYDEAEEWAEEAEDLARDAEDRIDKEEEDEKGDSDEIDEIEVEVDEGESEVRVEYDNGDEYEFDVEEDDEDDIIKEISDELDISENDVEDVIEFDYGDIDRIDVRIDTVDSLVRIFYESGVERRLRPRETEEDDLIEAVADELDMNEDEVGDLIDFYDAR